MNASSVVGGIAAPGIHNIGQIAERPGSAIPATTTAWRMLLGAVRTVAVFFFSFVALGEIALIMALMPRERRLGARAAWLHDWCHFACRVLGVKIHAKGDIPRSGLLVSNHLSYLDIIVLSAIAPAVFVAKSEVSGWPLFGWLARGGGTIFARRASKLHVADVGSDIENAIKTGALVVLFPEGTSSDGATVLPFRSALLEPAVSTGCNLTAAALDYSLSDGSVADEVCYWRDMTLVPHLLNLFGKAGITAHVRFGTVKKPHCDRKELACVLRGKIVQMRS